MLLEGLYGDVDTARAACRALTAVRSDLAFPRLLELFTSPSLDLRSEAWTTLRVRTGLELPLDPSVWERHLSLSLSH